MVGEDSLGSGGQEHGCFVRQDKEEYQTNMSKVTTATATTKLLTHDREPGSIALSRLAAVLVFGDAPVCGEGVLLLNVRDVKSPEGGQREPVTLGRHGQ